MPHQAPGTISKGVPRTSIISYGCYIRRKPGIDFPLFEESWMVSTNIVLAEAELFDTRDGRSAPQESASSDIDVDPAGPTRVGVGGWQTPLFSHRAC